MKLFNLERAIKGDPVVTRNGLKVNEIYLCKSLDPQGQNLLVIIGKSVKWYYSNGNFFRTQESEYDLLMDTKTEKIKVLIYKSDSSEKIYVFSEYELDGIKPNGCKLLKEIEVELEL